MILVRRSRDFGKLNWLFMGMTLLLLISAIVLGRTIGGAKNWINIGGFSFPAQRNCQSSVYYGIGIFSLSTRDKLKWFIPYMVFTAACVIIQVVAKDLRFGAADRDYVFADVLFRHGQSLADAGRRGSAWGRCSRQLFFVLSRADARGGVAGPVGDLPNGRISDAVQGLMALASGGLTGVGLGLGSPESIPAGHTDYIFTVIGKRIRYRRHFCHLLLPDFCDQGNAHRHEYAQHL